MYPIVSAIIMIIKKMIDSVIESINNDSIEFINTLIDFYGTISDVENASNIFDIGPLNKKDISCFNSMMNTIKDFLMRSKMMMMHWLWMNIHIIMY